jgi:hypothetical protein
MQESFTVNKNTTFLCEIPWSSHRCFSFLNCYIPLCFCFRWYIECGIKFMIPFLCLAKTDKHFAWDLRFSHLWLWRLLGMWGVTLHTFVKRQCLGGTYCLHQPAEGSRFAVRTVLHSIHVTQNNDPQLLYSILLGELLQAYHIVLSNSTTLTHMHSKLVVITVLLTTPCDIPP